MQAEQPF
jgi:hypothetical protein